MHLADICVIYKSDLNIICILSLLTTDSTSVPSPVFLSGGLPIHSSAGFPREISKIICVLKPVIHSGGIRLVLLSLKYRVMSFRYQNKTVVLSSAPPLHKTSPFFHVSSSPVLVLIVCRQFVKYAIALKFCDNMRY